MNSPLMKLIIIVLVILEASCIPSDWTVVGGRKYKTVEELQTWQESEAYCQSLGGHLFSAYNQTEEDSVVSGLLNSVGEEGFWIGLSDTEQTGQYRWSDNSTGTYRNYDVTDPLRNSSCVYLQKSADESLWYRENCTTRLQSICEALSARVTTTPVPIANTPPATPPTGLYCPSGWIQVNDSCYLVFGTSKSSRKNWTDAVQGCKDLGAWLATVHSQAAQSLVTFELAFAGTVNVWIGLYAESGQDFEWVDGSPVDFEKWAHDQPDGSNQNTRCVELLNNADETGLWNDDNCSYVGGYACEMAADESFYHTTGPIISLCDMPGFEPYRESCYSVDLVPRNFTDGEAFCNEGIANLASVVDGYEEAFIETLFFRNDLDSAWIGLKDREDEGVYQWTDGWPVWYTNWGHNEPSRGENEGCVALTSDGSWNDTICEVLRPSICKYTADVKPTDPPIGTGYCSEGGTPYNSSCYFVHSGKTDSNVTWEEAGSACQAMEANLASIHSKHENEFVKALTAPMGVLNFWLGLYRNDQDGFSWTDYSPVEYDNWGNRQPLPDEGSDCGSFNSLNGQWMAFSCDEEQGYICKSDKIPATTQPTAQHTTQPTTQPTAQPTTQPTTKPTTQPDVTTKSETSSVATPTAAPSTPTTNSSSNTTGVETSAGTLQTTTPGGETTPGSTIPSSSPTSSSQSTPTHELSSPPTKRPSTAPVAEADSSELSTGAIVGICIGCAMAVVLVAVLVILAAKGRIYIPGLGGDNGINTLSSAVFIYDSSGEKMRVDDKSKILPE